MGRKTEGSQGLFGRFDGVLKNMQIREIRYSEHFRRALVKLPPEVKSEIRKREAIFKANCFDSQLKTHKLAGKFKNYWSFSLTYSHRVVFQFLGKGKVGFIDVGDHSIYQ